MNGSWIKNRTMKTVMVSLLPPLQQLLQQLLRQLQRRPQQRRQPQPQRRHQMYAAICRMQTANGNAQLVKVKDHIVK